MSSNALCPRFVVVVLSPPLVSTYLIVSIYNASQILPCNLAVLAILIDPPLVVLVRRSRALSWLRVQRMRSRSTTCAFT